MKAPQKDGPGRESKSTKWCYDDKKVLISYADEKKSGTKVVLALTTMSDTMRVSKDQRKKTEPLVYYDHMKGGVDVVDLVPIGASTRAKTKRWTLNALYFLCDTVKSNAKTLYNEVNGKKLSNFEFTWQLGKELVSSFLLVRIEHPIGLQRHIVKKMKRVMKCDDDNAVPAKKKNVDVQCGRCAQCLESINITKGNSLNNKLRTKCKICGNFVCT